jgi:hypothetical protein
MIVLKMPRFRAGRLIATPGAVAALQRAEQSPLELVARHVAGDWGCVCDQDREVNEKALRGGGRILSAYRLRSGVELWVITEADRSSTCVLVPDEY